MESNHLKQPVRKDASQKTININTNVYQKMNLRKAKEEAGMARAGMTADAGLVEIRGKDQSTPVWDLRNYTFLIGTPIPYTVNPKLWEQGKFNLNAGLFQVSENIFQIRGFDLGNMAMIRGERGWIVVDCLTCRETAAAALQFAKEYFGMFPVSGVIITHSHADHYGGIEAVGEYFIDAAVEIYAPKLFVQHVIEENVTAGIAMSRRGSYQYGTVLPKDEKGQIDVGIGKGISIGTATFTQNVEEITQDLEEKWIDGVGMQFLLAQDTEAPSEMMFYIPGERALCIAEDANATMHNLYTLRGAKVRDAVAWAESIQNAIDLWGRHLTSVFGVHNWPHFGNGPCIDYLEKQRDLYQYINDQTLRLINQGYTIEEVGRTVKLPDSLADEWYNSQFYGTVNHNAKAVYQRYLGWYTSNPVDLNKLLPRDSAKKYMEYMGGEKCVLEKAEKSFDEGEYQWVAEVTKQVIYANPENIEAKLLCADALEQLGYIAESGIWRNEYLMGAQELRIGKITPRGSIISENVLDNIPFQNILYLLSIRIKGVEAGDFDYKINFIIPDRSDAASTQIKRGIFRFLSVNLANDAAVTVIMPKEVLYEMVSTNEKPDSSRVIVQGNYDKWREFLSVIDTTDPNFNIVTPIV